MMRTEICALCILPIIEWEEERRKICTGCPFSFSPSLLQQIVSTRKTEKSSIPTYYKDDKAIIAFQVYFLVVKGMKPSATLKDSYSSPKPDERSVLGICPLQLSHWCVQVMHHISRRPPMEVLLRE